MIHTIISGGQTGADQGGLHAGRFLGLVTGGYAPLGWKTEEGRSEWLGAEFGMVEWTSANYKDRTKENVRWAGATVIFGQRSPGSNATEEFCRVLGRPLLWIPLYHQINPEIGFDFMDWLVSADDNGVLNVAGNRESKRPGISVDVCEFLLRNWPW